MAGGSFVPEPGSYKEFVLSMAISHYFKLLFSSISNKTKQNISKICNHLRLNKFGMWLKTNTPLYFAFVNLYQRITKTKLLSQIYWSMKYKHIFNQFFFLFIYRGILLQNQQDYKAAVDSFQKAIHFRPSLACKYTIQFPITKKNTFIDYFPQYVPQNINQKDHMHISLIFSLYSNLNPGTKFVFLAPYVICWRSESVYI